MYRRHMSCSSGRHCPGWTLSPLILTNPQEIPIIFPFINEENGSQKGKECVQSHTATVRHRGNLTKGQPLSFSTSTLPPGFSSSLCLYPSLTASPVVFLSNFSVFPFTFPSEEVKQLFLIEKSQLVFNPIMKTTRFGVGPAFHKWLWKPELEGA